MSNDGTGELSSLPARRTLFIGAAILASIAGIGYLVFKTVQTRKIASIQVLQVDTGPLEGILDEKLLRNAF